MALQVHQNQHCVNLRAKTFLSIYMRNQLGPGAAELVKWHILPLALVKWGLNYLRSTWTLRSMLRHTYSQK